MLLSRLHMSCLGRALLIRGLVGSEVLFIIGILLIDTTLLFRTICLRHLRMLRSLRLLVHLKKSVLHSR